MNQSGMTDSNLSLDVGRLARESGLMVTQPYQLYIERTDPSKNMARFYAMSIEPTLFGETCLTRRWGRIGADGQKQVHHFACEQDAVLLFLNLVRQKRSRGYSTVGRGGHGKP
jgi:predicted DNA-binding WGR domain protein